MTDKAKKTGLALLREPFPENQISKLPKPTKRQTEEVRNDFKKGIRCVLCGQWHHPQVVHLDYVGHAALTDRLLDCDSAWNWEPVAISEDGAPKFDANGGMWIRLTVCDVTRLGYGHPDGKKGGDAIKETIGDALRNAAMRFGAALDLWHKGDLHCDDDRPGATSGGGEGGTPFDDDPAHDPKFVADRLLDTLKHTADCDLAKWKQSNRDALVQLRAASAAEHQRLVDESKRRWAAALASKENAA